MFKAVDIWTAWNTGRVPNIEDKAVLSSIRDSHIFMGTSADTRPELSVYLWAYKERLLSGATTSQNTLLWKNMEKLLNITTIQRPARARKIVVLKVGPRLADLVAKQNNTAAAKDSDGAR